MENFDSNVVGIAEVIKLHAESWMTIAECVQAYERGEYEKAMRGARAILQRDYNNVDAHFMLGCCYMELCPHGKTSASKVAIDKALSHFMFVYAKDPCADTCYNLGLVCLELGLKATAANFLLQIREYDKNYCEEQSRYEKVADLLKECYRE